MKIINRTPGGIYYLHEYIPIPRLYGQDVAAIRATTGVIAYKDGLPRKVFGFSLEILLALLWIAQENAARRLYLFAVPPSRVNAYSPVRDSISIACHFYENALLRAFLTSDSELIDCRNALQRVRSIGSAHNGTRPPISDQIRSLSCNADPSVITDLSSNNNARAVLLDDITTSGTAMSVSSNILIASGIPKYAILCFALARTIYPLSVPHAPRA